MNGWYGVVAACAAVELGLMSGPAVSRPVATFAFTAEELVHRLGAPSVVGADPAEEPGTVHLPDNSTRSCTKTAWATVCSFRDEPLAIVTALVAHRGPMPSSRLVLIVRSRGGLVRTVAVVGSRADFGNHVMWVLTVQSVAQTLRNGRGNPWDAAEKAEGEIVLAGLGLLQPKRPGHSYRLDRPYARMGCLPLAPGGSTRVACVFRPPGARGRS